MYHLQKLNLLIFLQRKKKDTEQTLLNSPKVTSPSSESSLAKTHHTGEESTEKGPLSKSKIDDTELTVSEVQLNKLESEKINVPSSENDSTILSVEEGNDSAVTKLIPSERNFSIFRIISS